MPEVFLIAPATTKPLWALAAIGAFLVLLLVFFGVVTYSGRGTRFELSSDGLAIRRTFDSGSMTEHFSS